MGFQNGFTATLLINGKPQRELNESGNRTVRIPFDSEYVIRIKNKTKKRAYASIDIDGTDVLGGKLILRAGETIDVERFVVDGDMSKGKRFKFVSAGHSEVQDPTSKENGVIRVTIDPEYEWPTLRTYINSEPVFGSGSSFTYNNHSGVLRGVSTTSGDGRGFSGAGGASGSGTGGPREGSAMGAVNCTNLTANNFHTSYDSSQVIGVTSEVKSDAGATVEGSVSNQQFQKSSEWFMTVGSFSIDIHMKGPKVEQPTLIPQQWYEFELMGRKAKSVFPLYQVTQEVIERAAMAIARAEVQGKSINGLTLLAESVLVD